MEKLICLAWTLLFLTVIILFAVSTLTPKG